MTEVFRVMAHNLAKRDLEAAKAIATKAAKAKGIETQASISRVGVVTCFEFE